MLLSTNEQDGNVYFRIQKVEAQYLPVVRSCYYLEDEQGFYKVYPASYPDIRLIRENFIRYGEEMFNQLGYFRPVPWQEGLARFITKIEGTGIFWWLTGSCAVCLRGIGFNPHDVDIMVNSSDIPQIRKLFSEDIFEPLVDTSGWVTKDFGVLFLSCRVDIASDPAACLDDPEPADCGPYAREHLEEIRWNGHSILVPPLELSLAINNRRQRWDRAKMLEGYLHNSI